MQNAKCKIGGCRGVVSFRCSSFSLYLWQCTTPLVGATIFAMRKDVVARYLVRFAMAGLYNKFTYKSTYTRICAPSNRCANCEHCDSCHGVPRSSRPTLLRCVAPTNPNLLLKNPLVTPPSFGGVTTERNINIVSHQPRKSPRPWVGRGRSRVAGTKTRHPQH